MTNLYTLLMLSVTLSDPYPTSYVELNILGGKDCDISLEDFDFISKCKSSFAAELIIDGKIVGSISLEKLSDAQIKALAKTIKNNVALK